MYETAMYDTPKYNTPMYATPMYDTPMMFVLTIRANSGPRVCCRLDNGARPRWHTNLRPSLSVIPAEPKR